MLPNLLLKRLLASVVALIEGFAVTLSGPNDLAISEISIHELRVKSLRQRLVGIDHRLMQSNLIGKPVQRHGFYIFPDLFRKRQVFFGQLKNPGRNVAAGLDPGIRT